MLCDWEGSCSLAEVNDNVLMSKLSVCRLHGSSLAPMLVLHITYIYISNRVTVVVKIWKLNCVRGRYKSVG